MIFYLELSMNSMLLNKRCSADKKISFMISVDKAKKFENNSLYFDAAVLFEKD